MSQEFKRNPDPHFSREVLHLEERSVTDSSFQRRNDGVSFDLGHLFDWLDLIVVGSVGRVDD
jgi:hypothetical protein